jgi:hypothetical protein
LRETAPSMPHMGPVVIWVLHDSGFRRDPPRRAAVRAASSERGVHG